jgi:hypothetical protein
MQIYLNTHGIHVTDEDEQNTNANIIIDAFNTTNEWTQPSLLYKQNQELLDALNDLVWLFNNGAYTFRFNIKQSTKSH